MAKRRHAEEMEIPFVALMDTMTNVVGVLIIVLVLVGISVASAVKKSSPTCRRCPRSSSRKFRRSWRRRRRFPIPRRSSNRSPRSRKTSARGPRTSTPSTSPRPVSILPTSPTSRNSSPTKSPSATRSEPRPRPSSPNSTSSRPPSTRPRWSPRPPEPSSAFPIPALSGDPERDEDHRRQGWRPLPQRQGLPHPHHRQARAAPVQLLYKDPDPTPFVPLMEKILGNKAAAQTAWPTLSGLVGIYQMDVLAGAWKVLNDAQLQPSAGMLETIGNISLVVRKPMPDVAAAIVAATKADYKPWLALDPSTDPVKPTIKVAPDGRQVNSRGVPPPRKSIPTSGASSSISPPSATWTSSRKRPTAASFSMPPRWSSFSRVRP